MQIKKCFHNRPCTLHRCHTSAANHFCQTQSICQPMHVRSYRPGDEIALWQVFHDAVHQLAVNHYSQVQLDAWAPQRPDWTQWRQRIQALQPFVAVGDNDQAMAYADLQANGYIDHFFVAPQYAR
ncbi:hypothetical protein [Comamonas testosteroni]|uniref:hypothetical protein n=1 Tax=Comamonas testosteroni TaxID=285 RepID=UPI0028EBA4D6|nr:hypothetical protein [Comamonas testosteroni]